MLASALALAEARGEHPVASLTLLTTLLDFHDTGVLKVFVDEAHALLRDHQFGSGGLMPGQTWPPRSRSCGPTSWSGTTWWATISGPEAAGVRPALLNGDSTNLLRAVLFLVLPQHLPGKQSQGAGPGAGRGPAADLTRLTMPAYIFGSREDHIVP